MGGAVLTCRDSFCMHVIYFHRWRWVKWFGEGNVSLNGSVNSVSLLTRDVYDLLKERGSKHDVERRFVRNVGLTKKILSKKKYIYKKN